MLKKSMSLILTLLILATVGPALAEEMAREGSATIKAFWTVTVTALPMGKELVQMNYDGYGVVVGDAGKGFFTTQRHTLSEGCL